MWAVMVALLADSVVIGLGGGKLPGGVFGSGIASLVPSSPEIALYGPLSPV